MITIVDGYNLLFARVEGHIDAGDAEQARNELVRLLNRYAASTQTGVIVVYDSSAGVGEPAQQRHGLVTIIYAKEEGRADAQIARIVRTFRNPAELRVVTSDQGLARTCKQARAEVVGSRDFLDLLGEALAIRGRAEEPRDEPDQKYRPPSSEEVQFWLKEFSKDNPKKRPPQ